jgi:hypothetical protein
VSRAGAATAAARFAESYWGGDGCRGAHDYGVAHQARTKLSLAPFFADWVWDEGDQLKQQATGCLNRLSALWWRIGGGPLAGRNRGTWSSQPELAAWNVGNALTASGQPLSASSPAARTGRVVLG